MNKYEKVKQMSFDELSAWLSEMMSISVLAFCKQCVDNKLFPNTVIDDKTLKDFTKHMLNAAKEILKEKES